MVGQQHVEELVRATTTTQHWQQAAKLLYITAAAACVVMASCCCLLIMMGGMLVVAHLLHYVYAQCGLCGRRVLHTSIRWLCCVCGLGGLIWWCCCTYNTHTHVHTTCSLLFPTVTPCEMHSCTHCCTTSHGNAAAASPVRQ